MKRENVDRLIGRLLAIVRQNVAASSARVILFIFACLIIVGTALLMLPFANVNPGGANLLDALFTATSAVCVTGLVVQDTASYWTPFGHAVILVLIQLGGLGVLTSVFFMRKLASPGRSIARRNVIREAIAAPQIGGIDKLTQFIMNIVILCEAVGALLVMPVFVAEYGLSGVPRAVFHSISSFCNAGFDVLGGHDAFSSLVFYQKNGYLLLVTSALVIIGGIGFLTWDDLRTYGLRWKRFSLQTKLVLSGTAILLAVPFAFFALCEYSGLPLSERLLTSFFVTVSPRTAGFAAIDYAQMSEGGRLLTIMLMLVGGAPGSTAGGVKVTTLMVVLAAAYAVMRRRKETTTFRRAVSSQTIQKALGFVVVYLTLLVLGALLMSTLEGMAVIDSLFECASALATVGLTTGVTPTLGTASKLLLVVYMYFGRIGGMTMAYALARPDGRQGRFPSEPVNVG